MSEITLAALAPAMIPEAAHVLARAFVTNPLHVAAFGPDILRRNETFFLAGLAVMKGTKRVALDGQRIVGVIHWVDAPACQFSAGEKLRMMPQLLTGFGARSAMRILSWLSAWSADDPSAAHVHLGPIGVAPEAQGRGIGRRLMDVYCDELDASGKAGYLETDRGANVAFYRRFEFETVREIVVLGVTNYLMERPPLTTAACEHPGVAENAR
jgi:ribosomal protein S18 acetylase RimI-like enzyme